MMDLIRRKANWGYGVVAVLPATAEGWAGHREGTDG